MNRVYTIELSIKIFLSYRLWPQSESVSLLSFSVRFTSVYSYSLFSTETRIKKIKKSILFHFTQSIIRIYLSLILFSTFLSFLHVPLSSILSSISSASISNHLKVTSEWGKRSRWSFCLYWEPFRRGMKRKEKVLFTLSIMVSRHIISYSLLSDS